MRAVPPPEDGAKALESALEKLRGDDWAAQFDAINSLRRLVAWDDVESPSVRLAQQLHSLNLLLIHLCDSLRSSLAKNAVVCFREMLWAPAHSNRRRPELRAARSAAVLAARSSTALLSVCLGKPPASSWQADTPPSHLPPPTFVCTASVWASRWRPIST